MKSITTIKQRTPAIRFNNLFYILKTTLLLAGLIFFNIEDGVSQNVEYVDNGPCDNKISNFNSLKALPTSVRVGEILKLPDTHTFQQIYANSETDDFNMGLSAYVPKNNSTEEGFLCINNGIAVVPNGTRSGGVSISNIKYNEDTKLWEVINLNSSAVSGTSKNSSGGVTPWGTFISSENHEIDGRNVDIYNQDIDADGYYKYGWQVEIDPSTDPATSVKRYEMGRFKHENAAIHPNRRTIYQGDDARGAENYFYKFVADSEDDLSTGKLYVYKDIEIGENGEGTGKWLLLDNKGAGDTDVAEDCDIDVTDSTYFTENNKWGSNNVKHQAACLGATSFGKIEDVEIGPDGKVYFIDVRDDGDIEPDVIYYFEDIDIDGSLTDFNSNQTTVNFLGVYIGDETEDFQIVTESGETLEVPKINSQDSMEFDEDGNLYICQYSSYGVIWVVAKDHTSTNPKVNILAIAPRNLSLKGMTFSPDNRFMFLSLLRERSNNTEEILDAAGNTIIFNQNMTVVIARKEHLGNTSLVAGCIDDSACNFDVDANIDDCSCAYPDSTCDDGNQNTLNDTYNQNCECEGEICIEDKTISENATTGEALQNLYTSSQTIQTEVTASDEADVIIRANETVDLKSNHITLNAGFKVESGACLNATIEPCQ